MESPAQHQPEQVDAPTYTSPSCPRAPTWVWHNRGMKHRAHLSTHQGDRLPCLGHCTFMVITRHHARGRGPLYHYVEPQWLHSTQLPRNAILPQACNSASLPLVLQKPSTPKTPRTASVRHMFGLQWLLSTPAWGHGLGAGVAPSGSYAGREQNTHSHAYLRLRFDFCHRQACINVVYKPTQGP